MELILQKNQADICCNLSEEIRVERGTNFNDDVKYTRIVLDVVGVGEVGVLEGVSLEV